MSNANNIKQENTLAIMRLLQREVKLTKIQIAAQLGLSNATVHNIISSLKEKGFCRESDEAVSTGGRNAIVHEINTEGGYIIGQIVYRNRITTSLFDYGLNVHYQNEAALPDFHDVRNTIHLMKQGIHNCMEANKAKRCIGVGIALVGRVNKQGTILNIPGYPEWRNVKLKAFLEEEISLPIYIENDENALTLSLKWYGDTKEYKHLVFLDVGAGVGAGVMLNGKLFFGSNNGGCEYGHVSIMVDGGPKCSCGNHGCLEAIVSDGAIIRQINDLPEYQACPITTIQEAIRECGRTEAAAGIFRQCSRYIAVAMEHIVKLYDPELIVIRNPWMEEMPQYFAQMQEYLFSGYCGMELGRLKVILSDMKINEEISSACVFFEHFYSNEEANIFL